MKKETIYKTLIALLIALNILQMIGRYLAHRPEREPIKMAVEHLDLDKSQETKFRKLAQAHRYKMISLRNHQEELIETYFDQPSDSILNKISSIQTSKIMATEKHFKSIKAILRKEQYDNFEKFKKNILTKILNARRFK